MHDLRNRSDLIAARCTVHHISHQQRKQEIREPYYQFSVLVKVCKLRILVRKYKVGRLLRGEEQRSKSYPEKSVNAPFAVPDIQSF
jgi:hypothetical protein